MRYQKHLGSDRLPPVEYSFLSKSWAISCILDAIYSGVIFFGSSMCVSIRKSAVSSTNTSPILFIFVFVGVIIWRHFCFFETEERIGSSTKVHIHGEAPDPWPLPKILRNDVEKYTESDIPCPVFSL